MIQNLILAGTLVLAFFMSVSAFIWGIRIGKTLAEGKIPQVQINPVRMAIKAVEQHEQKKEEEKLQDELTDIMGATRESMLNAIKKEVK
jgi:hypothetical protein